MNHSRQASKPENAAYNAMLALVGRDIAQANIERALMTDRAKVTEAAKDAYERTHGILARGA